MRAQHVQASGEHEFEPVHGLPGDLPPGEQLLWQGAPDWRALARHAFHIRLVAAYFGLMLLWRAASHWADGAGLAGTLGALLWPVPLALACLAMLASLAWLAAHSTVYSLTNRRVVMRVGIVLTVTFNLPLRQIASAGFRPQGAGRGDIALGLTAGQRIAYLHLWPHVRPWQLKHTQPMLRCLADGQQVAEILAQALRATLADTLSDTVGNASGDTAVVAGLPATADALAPAGGPSAGRPGPRPVRLDTPARHGSQGPGWPAAA